MPPPGNTAALAAAGLTVATMAGNPVADARGVILPANDAAALRGEQMLNPAGHTVAGNQRRSLRSRLQGMRSEEHTSELQSLMRISYAVFCLKKKRKTNNSTKYTKHNQ